MTEASRIRAQALWDRMEEARDRYPDGSWAQRWLPFVCTHARVRCVHGDEIVHRGFRRTACLVCGRGLKQAMPAVCWFTGTLHASAGVQP